MRIESIFQKAIGRPISPTPGTATTQTIGPRPPRLLERTLPLITERVQSVARLTESKLLPRDTYLELESERIEAEQDLATQDATRRSIVAAIGELEAQRKALTNEARRDALAQAEALEKRIAALRQEQVKAEQLSTQQLLTAPVPGEVQQLAVHTLGGVVRAGDPLMVIVPADAPVEIEALVLNKDIGFVREGQSATIKIEAFPFTRYGALEGEVISVSDDAIQDERLGLVYAARVQLKRAEMDIDGKRVGLSPGMAASVEVKTGRRPVMNFLLSPLLSAPARVSARGKSHDQAHVLGKFAGITSRGLEQTLVYT